MWCTHDVVALMKPSHVLTPAVFGNVIDKKLLCSKVAPFSNACGDQEAI